MASEGPLLAGAGASNSSVGSVTWSSPGNITADDTNRATATAGFAQSEYLISSSHGFAIPSGATIDGIVVEARIYSEFGGLFYDVYDAAARIVKGGAVGSTDKSKVAAWQSGNNLTWTSYGSSSDTWGETWTPADINASGFGFALSANLVGGKISATGSVYAIRITVYYTAGGGGGNRRRRVLLTRPA